MAKIPGITIPVTIKLKFVSDVEPNLVSDSEPLAMDKVSSIPSKKPSPPRSGFINVPPMTCATCCHWNHGETTQTHVNTWATCRRTIPDSIHNTSRSAVVSDRAKLMTRDDHFCAMWGPRQ